MAMPVRFSRAANRLICSAILHVSTSCGFASRRIAGHCCRLQLVQNPYRCLQCLSSVHCANLQSLPEKRSISSVPDKSLLTQQQSTDALDKVSHEISAAGSRLFAVVFVQGHQYKVTTNDLIQISYHIEPDIGERIRLEKVLLVGGDNFTLLGRPLLGLDQVKVEATVIEKTISQTHIKYLWKKRTSFKKYKEFITDYTVLRINSIEVSPNLK